MAETQSVMLALPPPRSVAQPGLRVSLRAAAAMPVEAVEAIKPSRDPSLGTAVKRVGTGKPFEPDTGPLVRPPLRLNEGADWLEVRFFGGQSGPFVAQQIGQTARTVAPTLEPSAEIAAYSSAQQRAEDMSLGRTSRLDVRA